MQRCHVFFIAINCLKGISTWKIIDRNGSDLTFLIISIDYSIYHESWETFFLPRSFSQVLGHRSWKLASRGKQLKIPDASSPRKVHGNHTSSNTHFFHKFHVPRSYAASAKNKSRVKTKAGVYSGHPCDQKESPYPWINDEFQKHHLPTPKALPITWLLELNASLWFPVAKFRTIKIWASFIQDSFGDGLSSDLMAEAMTGVSRGEERLDVLHHAHPPLLLRGSFLPRFSCCWYGNRPWTWKSH